MLIDWFTVTAQGLNFVILVWLLKRTLFRPIMAAIHARESLVASELTNAASKSLQAEAAVTEFKRKNDELDRNRAALIVSATEQANTLGAHLLDVARASADELLSQRRGALEREVDEFSRGFGIRAQQSFFALAKSAFKDLANGSLEEQMATLFCERLGAMSEEDTAKLRTTALVPASPVTVRVAFALSVSVKESIQTAVNKILDGAVQLRYEVEPALVCGIELMVPGRRIGWSIADYLAAFELGVAATVPRAGPGPASSPGAGAMMPALAAHVALS